MPSSWTPRLQAQAYNEVHDATARARAAVVELRVLDRSAKDKALAVLAESLIHRYDEILEANSADIHEARRAGVDDEAVDRLTLSEERVESLAYGLHTIAALPDPVGETVRGSRQRGGVELRQVRVPIGVVAVVFESQPAFVIQAAGLLLKTGNALLLHNAGGLAPRTDAALVRIVQGALATESVPPDSVQLLPPKNRAYLRHLATSRGEVDLVVPLMARGMPNQVLAEANVPVLQIGIGNCHIYIDATADAGRAIQVVLDSKIEFAAQSHSVETVLVHAAIAARFVPALCAALRQHGVSMQGDERFAAMVPDCALAEESEWRKEHGTLGLMGAVVDTMGDAVQHIATYGSGHTEGLVTGDMSVARSFTAQVDAATITVNTPTTFAQTAGNPLDPELAFSTQRLRPRGPLTLTEFTSTKWLVWQASEEFDPPAPPSPSGRRRASEPAHRRADPPSTVGTAAHRLAEASAVDAVDDVLEAIGALEAEDLGAATQRGGPGEIEPRETAGTFDSAHPGEPYRPAYPSHISEPAFSSYRTDETIYLNRTDETPVYSGGVDETVPMTGWADYAAPYPGSTNGYPTDAPADEHPSEAAAADEPAQPAPSPNDILNQLLSYAESPEPAHERPAPDSVHPEDSVHDRPWSGKPAFAQE